MGVAGIVILYHPDEDAIENIQSYLPYIDKLYVADNTENKLGSVTAQLRGKEKIEVIFDGNNEGIAKRLNAAAELAMGEGYKWLLTMDQDSRFEGTDMQNYLLCAGNFLYKDKTAMFGVEHEKKRTELKSCLPLEKTKLITSGSIINLALFAEIGGFAEKLFIDEVDFDYCYRARLKNYLIVQFQNVFLLHSLGTLSHHRSLKNMKMSNRTLHSPRRIYFMVRNFFYVNHHYKKYFPADIEISRKGLLNRIKNNLLYNRKRVGVLMNIFKGFIDYKLNKF